MDNSLLAADKNKKNDVWFWAGWEPARHYRRLGGTRNTFYFGNGPWVDKWKKRLFSNEAIALAKSMGATYLVTHFYKGFGRRVEASGWAELADFTNRCNEQGIKVFGYMQGRGIFSEFMRSENPQMDDWVSLDYHGNPQYGNGAYYRFAPCLSSESYRDYMVSIIRDGVRVAGLDGIHMDNSYYTHCWCPRCQRKFREYLAQRGDLEETTGIIDVENVKAPPLARGSQTGVVAFDMEDSLQIHWIKFGVQVRHAFFSALNKALKEENPNAELSSNGQFPRVDLSCELRSSINPMKESQIFDIYFGENERQARFENGAFIGQTENCLIAEAAGYRAFITSWREGEHRASNHPPDLAALWAVAADEFSFGSAVLGNNWALRSGGEKDLFLCEKLPNQRLGFVEIVDFFNALSCRISLLKRHSWTEVGILIDSHSLSISGLHDGPALRQLIQYFFTVKIPFRFIFPDQEIPESIRTLVAWSTTCLSQKTLDKLTKFADQPEKQVVLSQTTGQFNEWYLRHDFDLFQNWRKHDHFYVLEDNRVSKEREGTNIAFILDDKKSLDSLNRETLDGFFKSDAFHPQMRFSLPDSVIVHTEINEEGKLLVHFRDYSGSGKALKGGKATFSEKLNYCSEGKFYSPKSFESTLVSTPIGEESEFSIPPFSYYGLLILSEK